MSDPGTAVPIPARRWYRRLYVWVLTGMVLGAVTGLVAPEVGTSLEVLCDTFVSLLTMLLGPIIFCVGVAVVSRVGPDGPPTSTSGS